MRVRSPSETITAEHLVAWCFAAIGIQSPSAHKATTEAKAKAKANGKAKRNAGAK